MSALHELAAWAAAQGLLDRRDVELLGSLGLLEPDLDEWGDASWDDASRDGDIVRTPEDELALDHEALEKDAAERRRARRSGGRRTPAHRTSRTARDLRRLDEKVGAVLAEDDPELSRLGRLFDRSGAPPWEAAARDVCEAAPGQLCSALAESLVVRRVTAVDVGTWLSIDPVGSVLRAVELDDEQLPVFRKLLTSMDDIAFPHDELNDLRQAALLQRCQRSLTRAVHDLTEKDPSLLCTRLAEGFDSTFAWVVVLCWSLDPRRRGERPPPWLGSPAGRVAGVAWERVAELDEVRAAALLLEEQMVGWRDEDPAWLLALDLLAEVRGDNALGWRSPRGVVAPPGLLR